jgi:hypothetical protein
LTIGYSPKLDQLNVFRSQVSLKDSPASQSAEVAKKPTAEAVNFSGGDGGGSNSRCSRYCNLSGLLIQFLDQLAKLGETAGKLHTFENTGVDHFICKSDSNFFINNSSNI